MAVSAVVGLVTGIGAAIAVPIVFAGATITAFGFAVAFSIGAGFSALSRALIPKPDLGAQMTGTTVTTRDAAGPRKIIYGRVRVGGNVVFISHSGDDNKYLHMAVVFATHEIQAYDEIWFNDNKVWTATAGFQDDWGTYVTIDRKFGTAGQAASTDLVNSNSLWTTDHKLSGIAYIAFRLEWDQDKFPQGVPNITAIIRGKKVYDPRTETIAYSQNPALCVRDYLLDSSYGLGESASSINYDALEAAADLCEEQVSISGGGTQDRYECNGVINTANQIKSNIEQLLSCMGGKITYSGGEYFIDGAEYRAPTVTIDESVIISDIKIQTKQSRRSIYNGVKGTFISEEKNYKVLDYPAQISSTYATEDGDPIFLDMPLPFVSNNLQAQRLAKIALLKSRQQVVISMTVNLAGLKIKVGDTISVNYEKLGYTGKVFEVIGYQLAISNNGEIGVQLECIETAAAIYDWETSDEQDFLSGGELDLYDGRTVDNVTSLAKSEIGLLGPDGSVSTSVELTWTAPDDAFIDFYKIRYNKNGTTEYFHAETKEPRILLSGLDVTQNYDFRVQVQNLLGVTSTGVTLSNEQLDGDTTAPSPVTGVTITSGLKNLTVEWTNPTDADFAYVQIYASSTATKPASPVGRINGTEFVYPAKSGEGKGTTKYFWLEAVDYSGNVSTTVGPESENILLPRSDEIDGDVGEALTFGLYNPSSTTLGTSDVTFGEFEVPAPDQDIKKYGTLLAHGGIVTTASTASFTVKIDVERKSKGTTSGNLIGTIVASGSVAAGAAYADIAGNHMKEIDLFGGIATTQTSPSSVYNVTSVEYDETNDRTRIVYSKFGAITSGDFYYNADRWTSSGTWLNYSAQETRYPFPDYSGLMGFMLFQPLAKSNASETYRIRARHYGFTGTSVVMTQGIVGQIQLLS